MTLTRRQAVLFAGLLSVTAASVPLFAVDPYEPDDALHTRLMLLSHGARQTHELEGTTGLDYMLIDGVPGHSYEVRVSTATYFNALLTRRDATDGLLQAGTALAANSSRTATGNLQSFSLHTSSVMAWIEAADPATRSRYIRVAAGTNFPPSPASQYVLQMRETTLYCPRYNNTAGQITVLIMQRAAPEEGNENLNGCQWQASFFDQAYNIFGHTLNGSTSGSSSTSNGLATNGMIVLPTTSVGGVAGTSGSIQIAQTCGYGMVQAKAIALEPATGFTFETVCSPRPE